MAPSVHQTELSSLKMSFKSAHALPRQNLALIFGRENAHLEKYYVKRLQTSTSAPQACPAAAANLLVDRNNQHNRHQCLLAACHHGAGNPLDGYLRCHRLSINMRTLTSLTQSFLHTVCMLSMPAHNAQPCIHQCVLHPICEAVRHVCTGYITTSRLGNAALARAKLLAQDCQHEVYIRFAPCFATCHHLVHQTCMSNNIWRTTSHTLREMETIEYIHDFMTRCMCLNDRPTSAKASCLCSSTFPFHCYPCVEAVRTEYIHLRAQLPTLLDCSASARKVLRCSP